MSIRQLNHRANQAHLGAADLHRKGSYPFSGRSKLFQAARTAQGFQYDVDGLDSVGRLGANCIGNGKIKPGLVYLQSQQNFNDLNINSPALEISPTLFKGLLRLI